MVYFLDVQLFNDVLFVLTLSKTTNFTSTIAYQQSMKLNKLCMSIEGISSNDKRYIIEVVAMEGIKENREVWCAGVLSCVIVVGIVVGTSLGFVLFYFYAIKCNLKSHSATGPPLPLLFV